MTNHFLKLFTVTATLMTALLLNGNVSHADQQYSIQKTEDIPRFYQVNQNLYRGGRATAAGLAKLSSLGIKTIINLEDDKKAIEFERNASVKFGFQFASLPFSALKTPPDDRVEKVFEILNNPANYPIYIHCQHGEDRTGLMMGLYRVFNDKWSPADGYAEMKAKGFHSIFWKLKNYYEDKTGWDD